jgi:predicted membrane-bound spermidine synthase
VLSPELAQYGRRDDVRIEKPSMSSALPEKILRTLEWLFFASGFAALIYQIIWQRTLFGIYGINIESVTMIVTAFMIGLGAGSLAGGIVSRDPDRKTALWFAATEGSIGVYGLVSLRLFHWIGSATILDSPATVALVTFLMILAPTTLMGATLPLLVAHFTRVNASVGESVGSLYYMNTLGAAAGSLAAGIVLPGFFGQSGTLLVAAFLNFVAAAFAFRVHLRGATV